MKKIKSINIEENIWKKLKKMALDDKCSISNLIELLIEKEFVDRNEGK